MLQKVICSRLCKNDGPQLSPPCDAAPRCAACHCLSPSTSPHLCALPCLRLCQSEPSFQPLYSALLMKLGGRALTQAVVQKSCGLVRDTLSAFGATADLSRRGVLKSLGSWLGSITLARDQPLLQRLLDVKEMLWEVREARSPKAPHRAPLQWFPIPAQVLIAGNHLMLAHSPLAHSTPPRLACTPQAYESGALVVTVPFVAKLLSAAKASRVFRPPNPWTVGLLRALKEIYNVQVSLSARQWRLQPAAVQGILTLL